MEFFSGPAGFSRRAVKMPGGKGAQCSDVQRSSRAGWRVQDLAAEVTQCQQLVGVVRERSLAAEFVHFSNLMPSPAPTRSQWNFSQSSTASSLPTSQKLGILTFRLFHPARTGAGEEDSARCNCNCTEWRERKMGKLGNPYNWPVIFLCALVRAFNPSPSKRMNLRIILFARQEQVLLQLIKLLIIVKEVLCVCMSVWFLLGGLTAFFLLFLDLRYLLMSAMQMI